MGSLAALLSGLVRRQSLNGFRGVYRDFAEAQADAPAGAAPGYDHPATSTFYRELLDAPRHDDYPALFWLSRALAGARSILELGGHVGVAYYSFERLLAPPASLAWTILETEPVAEAGRALARERGRSNLRFVTDFAEIREPFDVLFASGSLQYIPGLLLPERVRAMAAPPRHIVINKTPVSDGSGFVTLQDLGVTLSPYRVQARAELIDPLEAMGYRVVDSWKKERRLEVPGHPGRTLEHFSGFYLAREG